MANFLYCISKCVVDTMVFISKISLKDQFYCSKVCPIIQILNYNDY